MRTFVVALLAGLLSQAGAVQAETLYFIHVDHLGTPRLAIGEDGVERWRWDNLEPFGDNAPIETMGTEGYLINLPLRFPGQYADKETNLHYNYFRDYDPGIGRYAQSDPIGLTGGMNTYGYVFQTPLRVFDSLGLYAYGDIVQFWNHYCDGTGASIATSFASINWGDMDERARATIAAMVGQSCAQRKIPVSFKMSAQAAGADRAIIGRHVVQIGGEIAVNCDCTWTYSGRASSLLGYDPYDFDASNRGFIGEASVWVGAHRCPNTGRAFKIYLTGSKANTASGSIDGGAPTCCGN